MAANTAVPYGGGWGGIDYRAEAGEINRVVLVQIDSLTIRVSDSGAVIVPGLGCLSIDSHTAQCTLAGREGWNGLIGANVRAGDLDDVVDSQGPGLSGNGGAGNDTLQSSSGAAGRLNGGGGSDVLLGGTNQDTLIDGDISGAADSDVMNGREGGAVVSYAGRTTTVTVDLADPRPDGERGEGDDLRSVTAVIGGSGDDVLRSAERWDGLSGGPGDDRLHGGPGGGFFKGGPGSDRLWAGAGDDNLEGGTGRDVLLANEGDDFLDGGPGADRLHAGAGHDHLTGGIGFCGHGRDTIRPSRERDYVRPDCEEAQFWMPTSSADSKGITVEPNPYRRDRDSIWFRGTCPYTEIDGYADGLPIRGDITLTGGGAVLARGRIPARTGPRCAAAQPDGLGPLPGFRVRVLLTPRGRGVLAMRRPVRVMVSYSGRNVPPVPWTIWLSDE